jgi:hypothetical protein
MDVRSDEARVRQLFDEVTLGQPDVPPDRYAMIRRRARRHRLTQAAGTLAVAAAIAAVAVGVGTSAGRVPPSPEQRSLPGWALPWPDQRNGSVPQRVLDGAVTAWRHQIPAGLSATAPANVIWYVGRTVAHGQAVAVIFEVGSGSARRLVAGWASAGEVMSGQPGWTRGSSPWVLYDVAAPRPTQGLVIGLNLHGRMSPPGRNPDNWIVLLAEPQVQSASWSAPGPFSSGSSGHGILSQPSDSVGIAPAVRGLAVADTGQITGPVTVDQLNVRHHNTLAHPVSVGVPGSADSQVPQLAAAAPVGGRPGLTIINEFTGQGPLWNGMSGISSIPGYAGRLVIRARCYGPGQLQLRLMSGIGNNQTALGTVPCDDLVHELVTKARLSGRHSIVAIVASRLTSYRVALGTLK